MEFLAYILLGLALFIIFTGILGFWKFKEVLAKVHAASLIESCGAPLAFVAISLLHFNRVAFIKILMCLLLVFLLNPVATNSLVKNFLSSKK